MGGEGVSPILVRTEVIDQIIQPSGSEKRERAEGQASRAPAPRVPTEARFAARPPQACRALPSFPITKLRGEIGLHVQAELNVVHGLGRIQTDCYGRTVMGDGMETKRLPFSLVVCGLDELSAKMRRFDPTHAISITAPNDDSMVFPPHIHVLRLAFHDHHDPGTQVARLILEFGRRLPDDARVLVHCAGGVSRSAAAAYLLLCQRRHGNEQSAFRLLKAIRPQAQPNPLLVAHGDALLNANGRMVAALEWR